MEDQMETTNVDQTPENSDVVDQGTVNDQDAETVVETGDAKASMDANERLLLESKKHKRRAQEAERKLRELEEAKNKEQGRYKELYESAKQKAEELRAQNIKRDVRAAVQSLASREGCVDVDALMKLGDASLLEYNEDDGTVEGTELFIERAKQSYSYLFPTSKSPSINSAAPTAVKNKVRSVSEVLKKGGTDANALWLKAMKNR